MLKTLTLSILTAMRIIAGAKRGLKLISPKTDISRPITDRVKESLFSVLYKYGLPEGKIIADLFSGVGSLGLESLSRGADLAVFVEKDHAVFATLKSNIEKAGFTESSKAIRADAFGVGAPAQLQKYDLIFIDPPYRLTADVGLDSKLGRLLILVTEQLADDGIAVVRTEKHIELLSRYSRLKTIERRRWSSMAVTILGQI
ncbi:MAG: 16S rRNA (guanine(966)-N(2))-methyltransferase RsmD [Planctomycetota bacterium]